MEDDPNVDDSGPSEVPGPWSHGAPGASDQPWPQAPEGWGPEAGSVAPEGAAPAPSAGAASAAGWTPPPTPGPPFGPGPQFGAPPTTGPPPPYPPPGYGYGPYAAPPWGPMPYGYGMVDHPEGTTILVLGIVSWVFCGLAAPFAWAMGNQALKEIDANPGRYANRSNVQIGRMLGIVWCCVALAGIVVVLVILAVIAVTEA